MKKLLEMLRGSDSAGELADMAGELAWQQERLQAQLEAGARPQGLQEEQERLQRARLAPGGCFRARRR
jgi:hypothetical protein